MTTGQRDCVVTGATSGIGRAVAVALARTGDRVWALGRRRERLEALAVDATQQRQQAVPIVADLERTESIELAVETILATARRVDVLVHGAGAIWLGPAGDTPAVEGERMRRVNLDGPILLTRALLPALQIARGHIVFVNSTAAFQPSADNGVYAETKQRLEEFANDLRDMVGKAGVRVSTIYVGRTDTPMQEAVHRYERRPYRPELLMHPEDVAHVIVAAIALPERAEIVDVTVRPMAKLPPT